MLEAIGNALEARPGSAISSLTTLSRSTLLLSLLVLSTEARGDRKMAQFILRLLGQVSTSHVLDLTISHFCGLFVNYLSYTVVPR